RSGDRRNTIEDFGSYAGLWIKLRYFSHQAFREWNAVVPVTITATSKNSVIVYLTHGREDLPA
ncbi:MAG: hypothetical protein WB522_01930, partial [Pseudolabrys sp.]